MPDDDHVLHLRLACQMQSVGNYTSGNKCPNMVFLAARELSIQPLFVELGIQITENWLEQHFSQLSSIDTVTDDIEDGGLIETALTSKEGIRMAPVEGVNHCLS